MSLVRDVLINITFNTLSVLNMLFIMQFLFGVGFVKKTWHRLAYVVTFLLMHAIMYFFWPANSMLHMILVYVYVTVVAVILSPGRRIKTILYVFSTLWIYIQWGVVITMVQDLLPVEVPSVSDTATSTFVDMFSDVVLLILLVFAIRYFGKKNLLAPITFWETILITAFSFFSPVFSEILEMLMNVRQSPVRSVVWTIFVVAVNVVVFYAIIHRRNARYYKMLSGNYKEQFNSEYSYFKEYKEQQQDVRRFRHDWNNHMLVLQSMLEKKEYEKAQKYFAGLSDKLKMSDKHFFTGNEIVDIILNAKAEQMEAAGIVLECNGGLEGLQFMEAADCCTLFSNIVDNAIEANVACEELRFIKIHSTINPGHLIVSVDNAMKGEIVSNADGLVTTKEEAGHGIGTKNAFDIIKKYNGEYAVEAKNRVFTIRMLFPIAESK